MNRMFFIMAVSSIVLCLWVAGCQNTAHPIPEEARIPFTSGTIKQLEDYEGTSPAIFIAQTKKEFGVLKTTFDDESIAICVTFGNGAAHVMITDVWQEQTKVFVRVQAFPIDYAHNTYTPSDLILIKKTELLTTEDIEFVLLDDYFREITRTTIKLKSE